MWTVSPSTTGRSTSRSTPRAKKWKNCLSHARSRTAGSAVDPCAPPPPRHACDASVRRLNAFPVQAAPAPSLGGWPNAGPRPGHWRRHRARRESGKRMISARRTHRLRRRRCQRAGLPLVIPTAERYDSCSDPSPNPLPQGEGGSNALKSAGFLPPPLEGGGWGRGRSDGDASGRLV